MRSNKSRFLCLFFFWSLLCNLGDKKEHSFRVLTHAVTPGGFSPGSAIRWSGCWIVGQKEEIPASKSEGK